MDNLKTQIVQTLIKKSNLKQHVFDATFSTFEELKNTLLEMSSDLDDELEGKLDRRVRLEYRDRGKYEAQVQMASDLLIFQMHTDVFEFEPSHPVHTCDYVVEDKLNSYCGIINIYNFLSDSFKHNRNADEGYLIGRIFINREGCYFVEGKQQTRLLVEKFGTEKINRESLLYIAASAVNYSINFDLLVPSFNDNIRVRVDQFNSKMDNSKFVTGKRLGYDYKTEDL